MPSAARSKERAGSILREEAAMVAMTMAGTATLVSGKADTFTKRPKAHTSSMGAKKAPAENEVLSPSMPANEMAVMKAKLNRHVARIR